MSNTEVELWALYRQKYGMLNIPMRIEQASGVIAATLANINRKPGSPAFKPSDFMINGVEENTQSDSGYNELEQALLKWQK